MKNYPLFILSMVLILSSCENQNKIESEKTPTAVIVEEATPLIISEFEEKAGNLVGKLIEVNGTVEHICRHGGQTMFLVSEDSDERIKVVPDEEIAAFNLDMEGSSILLTGVVEEQRVDENYLREWEEEIKAGSDAVSDKGEGDHLGGKVKDALDISEDMEKINKLREMIVESDTNYISFFSLVCTDYTIVDNTENQDHYHDSDQDSE